MVGALLVTRSTEGLRPTSTTAPYRRPSHSGRCHTGRHPGRSLLHRVPAEDIAASVARQWEAVKCGDHTGHASMAGVMLGLAVDEPAGVLRMPGSRSHLARDAQTG